MSLPNPDDQRKTSLDSDRRPYRIVDQCAVLTGTGQSAIAVIGVRGAGARAILARCFDAATSAELSTGQIRYGNWTGPQQTESAGESVVVTPIGPANFGADKINTEQISPKQIRPKQIGTEQINTECFEIHCHGGTAAIGRIIRDLQVCGATRIEASAWFNAENLLIREAQSLLSRCLTQKTAAIALDQVRGTLANWAIGWIDAMNQPGTTARGQPSVAGGPATSPVGTLDQLRQEANSIAAHAPISTRLDKPFRVVLIGSPNVGKSSLVNALVGYDRSITFDQAGTTRDVLHADTVIDGIPVRLSDTAGLRESDQAIEQEGVARARAAAGQADLLLQVSAPDGAIQFDSPSLGRVGHGSGQGGASEPVTLQVFNKVDLLDPGQTSPPHSIATNALTGDGIPELLQAIADQLGRSMPQPGQPVPINRRQADRIAELTQASDHDQVLWTLRRLLGEIE